MQHYVSKKGGRPHYFLEIQENVMTPTYEKDYVFCKYELL